jgi:hypothetical protein
MVKHLGNLSDRETVAQIQENIYIQYFRGYSSFTTEAPYSASLFVEFRKRLSEELLCKINDIVALHAIKAEHENAEQNESKNVSVLKLKIKIWLVAHKVLIPLPAHPI